MPAPPATSAPSPTVGPGPLPRAARLAEALLSRWVDPPKWSAAALSARADAVAGSDLHADEVTAPLEAICADLRAHRPTALGGQVVQTALLEALVQRRRLQRVLPPRPTPLRPPVVVLGWYRSGTTWLQALMASVPGYSFVPMHRLLAPVPQVGGRARAALGARVAHALAPELSVLHPVSTTGPEECWMLLQHHLLADGLAFHWQLPRFERWLAQVDRRPAYQWWAAVTAWLSQQLGHGLVLKDPVHLRGLSALAHAAPDARFVWVHRDPVACVASHGGLTAIQHRTVYGRFDPERAGRVCLDRLATYLERGLADRSALSGRRLVDVSYPALKADPVGTVRAVCGALDLPFDPDATEAVVRSTAQRRAVHRYDLAQWGLTEREVRDAVAFYEAPWWTAPSLAVPA